MIYPGATVRIRFTWRDIDKSLLTPDSQEWKMYDPDGTLKATNTNPTLENQGVYHWDYTVTETEKPGRWLCVAKAVKGSRNGVGVQPFVVNPIP